jgi:hypothetical protein
MLAVVDVVREPDRDAAPCGSEERVLDDLGDRRAKADIVEGDVEAALRAFQEVSDRVRDLVGALTAVGQRPDVDQRRRAALYSRFQP